ncbi:MAG: hypothetical protein QXE18_03485 [Thermoplasmata archaeon]
MSLVMPLCIGCIETGNSELSRKAAFEICQGIGAEIEIVSTGGIGESRNLDISDRVALLCSDIEISVGDYPAGPNSSIISCSDSKGWKRVISLDISNAVMGICSPVLSPAKITRNSASICISHAVIENMNLIVVDAR